VTQHCQQHLEVAKAQTVLVEAVQRAFSSHALPS
jgi:hypothetical protein